VILSSIAILRPNFKLHPFLMTLYLKLDEVKKRMESIVSGAVIQRIVLKDFRKFRIIVPPKDVQQQAIKEIEPLIQNCWSNIQENIELTQTRDYLLPKLISGEIPVN
ncbi:MAG: restriction endonuclease subunit S, partial [Bacteroidales bacterium]